MFCNTTHYVEATGTMILTFVIIIRKISAHEEKTNTCSATHLYVDIVFAVFNDVYVSRVNRIFVVFYAR